MHRFFITPDDVSGDMIKLKGGNAKHIEVLRIKKDELFCTCDGRGMEYICKLVSSEKESALCKIIERNESRSESKFKITLFQGLPKADKLELIIQKCVELGVYKIVPVITQNVVVKTNDNIKKKNERYNKISESAAQQSGRGIIPEVLEPIGFQNAVEMLSGMDEAYIAYEKHTGEGLNTAFGMPSKAGTAEVNIGFFVGSEGGFTDDEVKTCELNKINVVSLGRRILRAETAGFVMLTAYMYSKGEL